MASARQFKQIGLAIHNYNDYSEPGTVDDLSRDSRDDEDVSDELSGESDLDRRSVEEKLLDEFLLDLLLNENELSEEETILLLELIGP
jgi:hypothetical protein